MGSRRLGLQVAQRHEPGRTTMRAVSCGRFGAEAYDAAERLEVANSG